MAPSCDLSRSERLPHCIRYLAAVMDVTRKSQCTLVTVQDSSAHTFTCDTHARAHARTHLVRASLSRIRLPHVLRVPPQGVARLPQMISPLSKNALCSPGALLFCCHANATAAAGALPPFTPGSARGTNTHAHLRAPRHCGLYTKQGHAAGEHITRASFMPRHIGVRHACGARARRAPPSAVRSRPRGVVFTTGQ